MAITAHRDYETVGPVLRLKGVLKASEVFYKGALVVIDGGYFAKPTNAAKKIPIGVYDGGGMEPGAANIAAPGSGTLPEITVIHAPVWVPLAGASQADVGKLFCFVDNGTVIESLYKGSKTWAVPCLGFRTGEVLLDVTKPVDVS